MKVIEDREERMQKRKAAKRKFDKLITLSYNKEASLKTNPRYKEVQRMTLLEEGAVMMSADVPYFFIAKGTLERAYNALPDDYENYVDLGHMPFETFPISLGVFRKSDLHLVSRVNGRKAIEVDVRLNYKNPIVQALIMQPYDLAISARFGYDVNEKMTQEISEVIDAYVPVIDEIDLINYAIVGEPGNVTSDGLELKGGHELDLRELAEALESDNEMNLDALNAALDSILDDDDETADAVDVNEDVEGAETSEAETSEEETSEEETPEDEVEETAEEEVAEEETPSIDEPAGFAVALERIEELTRQIEELRAENQRITERLNAKNQAEHDFVRKIKSLSVSADKEREVTVVDEPVRTDGFGE